MICHAVFVAFLNLLALVNGAPAGEEVVNLPGLTYTLNFRHYSGYLKGSDDDSVHMHYW